MTSEPLKNPRILSNGYLVVDAEGCTCYGGGPYGHEMGCGMEPILDLKEVPGWSDLIKQHSTQLTEES